MATEIGKLAVRRSIYIAAPPERVWQEFESFERAKRWLGPPPSQTLQSELVQYEPGVGGRVGMRGKHRGSDFHFLGKITAFEPAKEATFEMDMGAEAQGWESPLLLTWRLTPHMGGTVVEMFLHGFEKIGPGAINAYIGFEEGWERAEVRALKSVVENASA